jgi:radical SAM protein with 4Fe4S-binding SPASM domain
VFNHVLLRLSFVFSLVLKRVIIFGQPEALSVEPVNACNLSCIECPTGTGELTREKTKMQFNDYKKIIDNSKRYLTYLILYFQGEPFLHNDLFKMISYAKHNNIFTYTSTNGHFLTSNNAEQVVVSGLDKITISLDGVGQDVYQVYRRNGDYNKVINGIRNLVSAKKKHASNKPFIEIQFLVFKHNQHQIKEIRELARRLKVNKLTFKTAQFYHNENKDLLTDIPKYSRYVIENGKLQMKKRLRNRCWRMWHSVVISASGDIVPCCYDKNAKYVLANINNLGGVEVRTTTTYKQFAYKIITNRKSIDICRNCYE